MELQESRMQDARIRIRTTKHNTRGLARTFGYDVMLIYPVGQIANTFTYLLTVTASNPSSPAF